MNQLFTINMIILLLILVVAFIISNLYFDNNMEVLLIIVILLIAIAVYVEILEDYFLTISIMLLITIMFIKFRGSNSNE